MNSFGKPATRKNILLFQEKKFQGNWQIMAPASIYKVCQIYKERVRRSKAEKEQRAASMTAEEIKAADLQERRESMIPYSTYDQEHTFGLPVREHKNVPDLRNLGSFTGYANFIGGGDNPNGIR